MTVFKFGLAASTALTLSALAAHAGDNNEVFLEQTGQRNTADILQSTGGLGGSQIGTATFSASQVGIRNVLVYSDEGSGDAANRGNNDILTLEQTGNRNKMKFRDWEAARDNVTRSAVQTGQDNDLRVRREGGVANVIDSIIQAGDDNHIRIAQKGTNGVIGTVGIFGSGNGGASRSDWQENWGILIRQDGTNNTVGTATIEGDDNDGFPGSTATAMRINQTGDGSSASAIMMSSNGSFILIDQGGTGGHTADVRQGISTSSTGNHADLDQNGQGQSGVIEQFGDGNYITARQDGAGNTLTARFFGDGNGVGTMTGPAGALTSSDIGDELFVGNVFQDNGGVGAGNSITYEVTGSNNLFAFAQIGAANSISGAVGTTGVSNGNQVAVLQVGSGNGTSFTQNGGNNNLAVSQ